MNTIGHRAHQHRRPDYCVCNSQALEPDEQCPVHGQGEWPPRCAECGAFMRWPNNRLIDRTESK